MRTGLRSKFYKPNTTVPYCACNIRTADERKLLSVRGELCDIYVRRYRVVILFIVYRLLSRLTYLNTLSAGWPAHTRVVSAVRRDKLYWSAKMKTAQ